MYVVFVMPVVVVFVVPGVVVLSVFIVLLLVVVVVPGIVVLAGVCLSAPISNLYIFTLSFHASQYTFLSIRKQIYT